MARFARVILPGVPYHITHCGKRRRDVFFDNDERVRYLTFLKHYSAKHGMKV